MLSRYLDQLAIGVMTRSGRRAFILEETDNVLLVRNGQLMPIFATVESAPAQVGAIWVSALAKIAKDETSTLNFETAIVGVLRAISAPDKMIQMFQRPFAENRTALHSKIGFTQSPTLDLPKEDA